MPLEITPPERFYGEQLGFNLFERGRAVIETGLLDLAFVLDGLIRLGEVPVRQIPAQAVSVVKDWRFVRVAAVAVSLTLLFSH